MSGEEMAKLTESDVRTIRTLMAHGVQQSSIAKMFGVRDSAITYIKKEQTWRHVIDVPPIEEESAGTTLLVANISS